MEVKFLMNIFRRLLIVLIFCFSFNSYTINSSHDINNLIRNLITLENCLLGLGIISSVYTAYNIYEYLVGASDQFINEKHENSIQSAIYELVDNSSQSELVDDFYLSDDFDEKIELIDRILECGDSFEGILYTLLHQELRKFDEKSK